MKVDQHRLGGFRLLDAVDPIGEGGQGAVHRAICEHADFQGLSAGAIVALKIVPVSDADDARWQRMESMVSTLSRLDAPDIVRYYGCFRERAGVVALHVAVMEFLEGETLRARMARNPGGLDADVALGVVRAAAAGLGAAAKAGIVHRDVKPENIFLCSDGRVKVIDFGIAFPVPRVHHGSHFAHTLAHSPLATAFGGDLRSGHIFGSPSANVPFDAAHLRCISQSSLRSVDTHAQTLSGCASEADALRGFGSFDYMAPERADQNSCGDECADVFSLGVVLHVALFGRLPYADQTIRPELAFFERWSQKNRQTALTLDGRAGRVVAGIDEVLGRALSVEREGRFHDFAAFSSALQRLKPHEVSSEKETYRMVALMGEGGFGEVFRARRLRDGATVAIKHLKRMDGDAAKRFRGEARAMAALDDSAIVRFHEYFEAGHIAAPQAYLVMAYLDDMPGGTLRDAMAASDGRGLPCGDVLAAFARYAHALTVLNEHGIVHRDVKPSNLYYPSADISKAAIMDLGVALDWNATLTAGFVPGTPDYMPPEMITGNSRGSPASDVYALGLCLYEALTGRPAFPRFKRGASESIEAFVVRARQMRAPELDAPLVAANPDLKALLRRMTEPDVARRMSSAAEAEIELLDLLDAFKRGDWHVLQAGQEADISDGSDVPTVDAVDAPTADDRTPAMQEDAPRTDADTVSAPPVPFMRRIIRNRRELFLVIALIIELVSNAVIIWQRPKSRAASDQEIKGSGVQEADSSIAPAVKYIDALQLVGAASCRTMGRQDASPTELINVFNCHINNPSSLDPLANTQK